MVRPRRRAPARPPAPASASTFGSQAAFIAFGAISLFAVTSLLLHSAISNAEDYLDDESSSNGRFMRPLRSKRANRQSKGRKKKRPVRMDGDVNLDETYRSIRELHDRNFPPNNAKRLIDFAASLRGHDYQLVLDLPYDVNNCPSEPPEEYPLSWPVMDVIKNWNPNDTSDNHSKRTYQGICRFDATTEIDKALAYREAEVPFVIRDDPVILQTVERWNQPEYLLNILGKTRTYRTEMSPTNQLMFFRANAQTAKHHPGWKEPITQVEMSFPEWLERASNSEPHALDPDKTHWYFRLNAKSLEADKWLFEEHPYFHPKNKNFYMVDPSDARGINCRFGMRGNTAESHFDMSRNFIVVFGPGERRYILSDPSQCKNLCLYPVGHPSARHTQVDWSDPDLDSFPQFQKAMVHEVVLQAGDVLYLPTNYFHHIISLDTNFQCNARSGVTDHYMEPIRECGFASM